MSRALLFLQSIGLDEIRAHEVNLTRRMLDGFATLGGITVYGPAEAKARLGVVSFNVEGVSELLAAAVLSEEGGVAVRAGRFCSHIYMDRLLAIEAAKHPDAQRPTGAVRASVGLYNDRHDIDRLLEFTAKVRARAWIGRYRMKGDNMSAEFAGRCADRWMEATHEGEGVALGEEIGAPRGYEFEILQPDSGCRSYLIADPETKQAAIVDPIRERVDDYLDLPAVVARARPEVDDPVGVRHHRLVVLDDDDRLPGVDQPIQEPEQLLEVGQVQPGGRLVEHVDAALVTHVRRELEPLPLTTRQRGERLAEPQVAEPHVGHPLQDRVRGRRPRLAGVEEADRVVDR
jgi:hypothetical protein